MCLVAWLLNENEAGGDLVLIETSLLILCKSLLISIRTESLTYEKQGGFYQTRSPPASLSFKGQETKQATVEWSIDLKRKGHKLEWVATLFNPLGSAPAIRMHVIEKSTSRLQDKSFLEIYSS